MFQHSHPQPRVCRHCSVALVRRTDEPTYNFNRRVTCSRSCATSLPRKQNRVRVIAAGHGTPCWMWQLATSKDGYGVLSKQGKTTYAHRFYFVQANGPIPAGMDLDHLCRNRACVNPAHLEPVEHVVNVRRGAKTKLTADQVLHIRSSQQHSRVLARIYGVDYTTIIHLRNRRKSWKGIEPDQRTRLAA